MHGRRIFRGLFLWLAALGLLWLALRDVDWQAVRDVITGLTGLQVAVLLLVNIGIVVLFGARWWLILHVQGYRLPLLQASAYRLAAFGVSYFTPGPHFGGEPLQVYLVVQREGVPAATAAASVILDKLLELTSNFAFLAFGVTVLIGGGLIDARSGPISMAAAGALLILPLSYLLIIAQGQRPLTKLLDRFINPEESSAGTFQAGRAVRIAGVVRSAEFEAAEFVRRHQIAFLAAVLLSGLVWAALVLEYLLAVQFLGLSLNFRQVISVITAARLAILLPMPGGLGTLEAAMVFVTSALGEGAAAGAGLSLLIRVRDIIFGLIGLWLGRRLTILKVQSTE